MIEGTDVQLFEVELVVEGLQPDEGDIETALTSDAFINRSCGDVKMLKVTDKGSYLKED